MLFLEAKGVKGSCTKLRRWRHRTSIKLFAVGCMWINVLNYWVRARAKKCAHITSYTLSNYSTATTFVGKATHTGHTAAAGITAAMSGKPR